MRVAGRSRGGGQVSEVYGLLEEASGRSRRGDVIVAAGHRDGGSVRRPGRRQYAVDGEERRADGRRLRLDGRGTGRERRGHRLSVAVGVAVARLSWQNRLVAAFVRRCCGRHGRRGRAGWPFRPIAVVAQARGRRAINAAVAPESSVQFHSSHVGTT